MLDLQKGSVLLIGCGRMGLALLEGWLANGVAPCDLAVEEPFPSARLKELESIGLHLNAARPEQLAIVVLAVKPQMMTETLAELSSLPQSVPVLSVAAGVRLAQYETALGKRAILRAMPNTPAMIGRGVTALIGNAFAKADDLSLAEGLLATVGTTVRIESETQMDAVTAISGSGPAYVFLLVEALTDAASALGLNPSLSSELARETVMGATALMETTGRDAAALRQEVTSPGGTTAAALQVLTETTTGLPALLRKATEAAAARSRLLGSD